MRKKLSVQDARKEGREEGFEEGLERGELRGKIIVLQEMLGDAVTSKEELDSQPLSELGTLITQLQSRLRNRKS